MAVRHAITKYPNCGHIWFLDQNALILNPKQSLEEQILDRSKSAEIMTPETPVVPDSIIKTFGHLQVDDAALLISQDKTGLVTDSMIIKNGEWAKFLLEQWLDPLYRSYNFEKAERHALVSSLQPATGGIRRKLITHHSQEHTVQWHPTVLSKLALVPQSLLAPYSSDRNGVAVENGGFVVLFEGCQKEDGPACAQELEKFWPRWNNARGALRQ
jgi:mannan polymerase II complex MNN11 subunit